LGNIRYEIQDDNKIVIAGSPPLGNNVQFTVCRFDENGTIDPSFGKHGIATTSFSSYGSAAYCLAMQPDKKILAAGYAYVDNTDYGNFAVARCKENGKLDSSFGVNGKQTTDFGHDTTRHFPWLFSRIIK